MDKLNFEIIPERMRQKLASGRYCLVLIAGFVFVYAACSGQLEGKDVMIILLLVFKDYFGRDRSGEAQS